MCSRYQFIPSDHGPLKTIAARAGRWSGGDVTPGSMAPVLVADGMRVTVRLQSWGIPLPGGKRAINARAETVCKRTLFQKDILLRRCVVPATGFYEWDSQKHRYLFQMEGQQEVYLAGIYDEERCFAILTTVPNASVQPIHDRMPLLLTEQQIRPWLMDADQALRLLGQTPPLLKRTCEDGQLSFFP